MCMRLKLVMTKFTPFQNLGTSGIQYLPNRPQPDTQLTPVEDSKMGLKCRKSSNITLIPHTGTQSTLELEKDTLRR
jgi:hypothetical protein